VRHRAAQGKFAKARQGGRIHSITHANSVGRKKSARKKNSIRQRKCSTEKHSARQKNCGRCGGPIEKRDGSAQCPCAAAAYAFAGADRGIAAPRGRRRPEHTGGTAACRCPWCRPVSARYHSCQSTTRGSGAEARAIGPMRRRHALVPLALADGAGQLGATTYAEFHAEVVLLAARRTQRALQ